MAKSTLIASPDVLAAAEGLSITNRYAAGAISMYLDTEHLMLRLFDPETFLNDLISTDNDYCSAFLVNSLLALASQIYVKEDPKASIKSLEFEKEARLLWRADREDSIPNLAGLMFLYIAMANNGNGNQGAANYVFEAGEMAKRMELFGVHDKIAASRTQLQSEEAKYALRQASWGLFNIYKRVSTTVS
ncbi:hypothetical protein N0V91_008714 [Didymella pomorum]|uniref:Transcription factor domain-containing protein n=1 Tax=Didymella pomorum TaxID=749634 RepID=A0A9W9D4L1_9PLEO|nr:hypothetical protein N0V91_008714 [Didymella pomorum]